MKRQTYNLKLPESSKWMWLGPILAGGSAGLAHLSQGHYAAAMLSAMAGAAMSLILLGGIAVGSLLVGRFARRKGG
jgi:hypothetical protein